LSDRVGVLGPILAAGLIAVTVLMIFVYPPASLHIASAGDLAAAIVLLLLGMLAQYGVWHVLASACGPAVSLRRSLTAHGLTIWGKYIPGKVWSVIGRSAYLARAADTPAGPLLAASSVAQVLMIAGGLIVALPILASEVFQLDRQTTWIAVLAVAAAGALALVIGRRGWSPLAPLARNPARVGLAAALGLCAWLAWGAGFSHLVGAIGYRNDLAVDAAIFAGSATAGILSFVAPGGLGVREGAMSILFGLHGFSIGDAALISIAARIWFVVGEAAMFACGLACSGVGVRTGRQR